MDRPTSQALRLTASVVQLDVVGQVQRVGVATGTVHLAQAHDGFCAIERAVAVAVARVHHAAATRTGAQLERIIRASIVAAGDTIAVQVSLYRSIESTAGALVVAVSRAVRIGIHIRSATATRTGRDLQRIVRTSIGTVRCAIEIRVGLRHTTTAEARRGLRWIARATVIAIGRAIAIAVAIGHSATARTRGELEWIRGTAIKAIDGAVCIGIVLRAEFEHMHQTVGAVQNRQARSGRVPREVVPTCTAGDVHAGEVEGSCLTIRPHHLDRVREQLTGSDACAIVVDDEAALRRIEELDVLAHDRRRIRRIHQDRVGDGIATGAHMAEHVVA